MQRDGQHHRAGALLRTLVIGLTAFLTVVDLFATQAILPSLARAYHATPAAMGFAVNASTIGMAVAGLAVALLQPPHRSPARHPARAWRCCRSRRRCWRSRRISPSSRPCASCRDCFMSAAFTLTLAYLGEQCSAERHRQRLRRLYHRQCREQSVRPADVGRGRRSSRPGGEFLCLRAAQSRAARCWSISRLGGPRRWRRRRGRRARPSRAWREHLRNPPLARQLRHRLLHPLRLHRHLHLREFRAGAPALRARHDAARASSISSSCRRS